MTRSKKRTQQVEIKQEVNYSRKRRAASPSPSDPGRRNWADEWAEKTRRENAKRHKPETPSNSRYGASSAVSNSQDPGVVVTPKDRNNRQGSITVNGIQTPPQEEMAATSSPGEVEVPLEVLRILRSRGLGTKLFQSAVDDVVDPAFAEVERAVACGMTSLEAVTTALHNDGAATENRIAEVDKCLREATLRIMAKHLGQMITSSDDLHKALNAVAVAVPFRPDHNGFLFLMPPTADSTISGTGGRDDATLCGKSGGEHGAAPIDESQRLSARSCSARPGPQRRHGVKAKDETPTKAVPSPIPKQEPQDRTNALTELVPHHAQHPSARPDRPAANAITLTEAGHDIPDTQNAGSKQRTPHVFDIFFLHLSRYRLDLHSRGQNNPEESGDFRRRARILYDSLDSQQKAAWRAVHRELRTGSSGHSHNADARKLLEEQDTCSRWSRLFNTLRNVEHSEAPLASMDIAPMLVPYVRKEHCDGRRRVVLVVNTPDVPPLDISSAELRAACDSAFPESAVLELESWSAHVWAVTFGSMLCANRAKGRVVDLDGVRLTAEHLYEKAPTVFISDFSDVDVNEAEIARQVQNAFATEHYRPRLFRMHVPKLYAGRHYRVSLPPGSGLLRFYIPMDRAGSSGVHMACFRPLNHTAPCALCREPHGLTCAHAKVVALPSDD